MKRGIKINQTEKDSVINALIPAIKRIVDQTIMYFPDETGREDFVQIGIIGVLKSFDKFNENKMITLQKYLLYRAKSEILDEYRKIMPRSRHSWANQKKIEAVYKELEENNIEPTYDIIAKKIGSTVKKLHKMISQLGAIKFFSFENYQRSETISDGRATPFGVIERKLQISQVSKNIKKLTRVEQLVLSLYYEEELGLKEIGKILDISESRACQIKNSSIMRLRTTLLK